MRTKLTVHHNEHVSSRSFDEVVRAFEAAVGSVKNIGLEALWASTKSAEEFESQVQAQALGRLWKEEYIPSPIQYFLH